MTDRMALYHGCYDRAGHFLYDADGRSLMDRPDGFPSIWGDGLMDTGFLKNGKRPDIYDGKVFWTGGGRPSFWFAFFWWDRSGDKRLNSNSGFYVRGFDHTQPQEAFDYACATFPKIVSRQRQPLILQLSK